jgi:hypothetical protein
MHIQLSSYRPNGAGEHRPWILTCGYGKAYTVRCKFECFWICGAIAIEQHARRSVRIQIRIINLNLIYTRTCMPVSYAVECVAGEQSTMQAQSCLHVDSVVVEYDRWLIRPLSLSPSLQFTYRRHVIEWIIASF